MKRYLTLLLTALALSACAPTVTPEVSRDGNRVTASISVSEPLALTSLILSTTDGTDLTRAEVKDPRCVEGHVEGLAVYMACDLGSIPAGGTAKVVAVTASPVACLASGYVGTGATDLRTIPCAVAGSD